MNHRPTYLAAALLVLAAGCGGPAHKYDAVVTGTVTIDGELATSGLVTFHPVDKGQAAIGRIHPDGSYSLRTGQGDLREVDGGTVQPGEYVVTASITAPPLEESVDRSGPPIPGPSLIAAKYATKETSNIRHTVKPGSQVIVLELERAEVLPSADETGEKDEGSPADDKAGAADDIAQDSTTETISPSTVPASAPANSSNGTDPAEEDSRP
jgi:hypothetical protein